MKYLKLAKESFQTWFLLLSRTRSTNSLSFLLKITVDHLKLWLWFFMKLRFCFVFWGFVYFTWEVVRERELCLLIHFSNGPNSQCWASLTSQSDCIQISYTGGKGLHPWTMFFYFPVYINRELTCTVAAAPELVFMRGSHCRQQQLKLIASLP